MFFRYIKKKNHTVAASEGSFAAVPGKIYHCPIFESEVAGTAGAGDAFGATFASAIAQGDDIERALRMAAINAASVVGHVDTQTGLKSRSELEETLESSREKFKVRAWPSQAVAAGSVDA